MINNSFSVQSQGYPQRHMKASLTFFKVSDHEMNVQSYTQIVSVQ